MIESAGNPAHTVLVFGALTVVAMLLKSGLGRIGLPSLIGFLALGLALRVADEAWGIFSETDRVILSFAGKAGLVTLLFRVGLESNLKGLLKQLRKASSIWMADVAVSGAVGYATAYYLLGMETITSLVVATAFTATSVGISVAVWQEMNALRSRNGELLIDIAELDDISAVILMALLFTVLPQLEGSGGPATVAIIPLAGQVGLFLLKLIGFGAFCFLFSRYVEKPVTHFFEKLETSPDPMLTVAGIGFMIAAMADSAGFSMAIGAFFAGLIFSRDPDTVKMEASFMPIYDFFSPFFFIGIGLNMDPTAMDTALAMGAVLAVAAIGGKFLADGLPVYFLEGRRAALLIGSSMIPRAEITMVIMQRGQAMGAAVVPAQVFNAMIVVSALTCLLAPFSVRSLLRRWPQESSREEAS